MKLKRIAVAGALLILAAALMFPQGATMVWYMVLYSVTYANLSGSAANGSIAYCSDCTAANPCSGSGTGSMARREGGAWNCGGGAGGSSAFSALTSGSNTSATMTVGTGASLGPVGTGTIAANLPVYCADAGSNDTYACSASPVPTGYVTGGLYRFKANTANTGAASINFNSLGAKTIVKVTSGITTTLADNDIRAGQFVDLVYDGTNMQMQSTLGNAAAGGSGPAAEYWQACSQTDINGGNGISQKWDSVESGVFGRLSVDSGYGGATSQCAVLWTNTGPSKPVFAHSLVPVGATASSITVDPFFYSETWHTGAAVDLKLSAFCATVDTDIVGNAYTDGSTVSTTPVMNGSHPALAMAHMTVPVTCAAGKILNLKLIRVDGDVFDGSIWMIGTRINWQ